MNRPRWYSQPFPPAGSISAEGIKRTLGKPPLPWPAILVREAAQNSWDAKVGEGPVEFALNLAVVPPQNAKAWRTMLLEGAPHSERFPLRQILRGKEWHSPMVRTLTVSDRGTRGLGGPTRADVARGDEARDWVSFVLNVGDPPDTARGGGTYGYGKGVLYQVSRAGTVVVHTRTMTSGGPESRLIGICLGESMELVDNSGAMKPYTGRHWWGRVEQEHVEPLVGDQAMTAAEALGLRAFSADETGTDVIIVEPDFGEDSDEEVARYLADAIAWNLWPIMIESRGVERLMPRVWHRGVEVPVPVPEKTRGLRTFVTAYRKLTEGGEDVHTLSCLKPKRQLGRMALDRRLVPTFEPPPAAQDLGITETPHHVCLLRTPQLVVKYYEGPVPISANLTYAGVFKAFDEMDRTFAAAEPPTHDDWVFAQLEGPERTFVRTAFVRIKERLAEFARPAEERTRGVQAPLGAASNFLGSLVAAATGSGAASVIPPAPVIGSGAGTAGFEQPGDQSADRERGVESQESNGGAERPPGKRDRVSIRLDGEPYFEDAEIGLLLVQDAVVQGTGHLTARASVGVMVADGSREQDPPEGAEEPFVIGWRIGSDEERGATVTLTDAEPGQRLSIVVRPVPDTITQVDVAVLRGEETVRGGR